MAGRIRSGIHLPFSIPNQKKNPFCHSFIIALIPKRNSLDCSAEPLLWVDDMCIRRVYPSI
jgi:hypothetical protein